jgi:geranylgeranyl diphosphate synthase, type II
MVIQMRIDSVLENEIDKLIDSDVKEAMRYSLMAGGKRIRPNLLYSVVKGYGLDEKLADEFACALEMIHSYSLIHDDLPAMDDDALRRGVPTCHKKFGEATAILAGDGLLTYAFRVASSSGQDADKVVKCIQILSDMAGSDGMVLGQVLDMNESESSDWEYIKKVHRYKTGCLLSAPLMIGAVLAGCNQNTIDKWHSIGISLGLAFQIQDDILDIELTSEEFGKSNSDERNDKKTSVNLLGKDEAYSKMEQLYQDVKNDISQMNGFDSKGMIEFIERIEKRRK